MFHVVALLLLNNYYMIIYIMYMYDHLSSLHSENNHHNHTLFLVLHQIDPQLAFCLESST